jgi:HK97 family phage prohead protease
MTKETRSFGSNTTNDGNKLVGYAAVWNSPTQITEGGRSFTETIRSGSFSKALASKADIIATFNHNPDALLARVSNNSLRLSEDSHGLKFEIDLPDTQLGRDLKTLTNAGTLNGASFTFNVRAGGDKWDGNTREIRDVYLYELGPVSQPAYVSTSLGMRSQEHINKKRIELLNRI